MTENLCTHCRKPADKIVLRDEYGQVRGSAFVNTELADVLYTALYEIFPEGSINPECSECRIIKARELERERVELENS